MTHTEMYTCDYNIDRLLKHVKYTVKCKIKQLPRQYRLFNLFRSASFKHISQIYMKRQQK